MAVTCTNRSLPRDLDLSITVSRPQVESVTDLSVMVGVVNDAPNFGRDNIRYYTTISGAEADFAAGSEGRKIATRFFAQSPRAQTLAIGFVSTSDIAATPACLDTGTVGTLAAFQAVTDGSFQINMDGFAADVTAMDFSSAASLSDVAATIQTRLRVAMSGQGAGADEPVVSYNTETNRFRICTENTGSDVTISQLTAHSGGTGTDVSGSGFMNGRDPAGTITNGLDLVPGVPGIADKLATIAEAGRCSGRFIYGWVLDHTFIQTDQVAAATWIAARVGVLGLGSSATNAYDAAVTTDIGSQILATSNERVFLYWYENLDEYAEAGLLAYMLHVNYNARDSTVTAKFKDINGVTPAGITETQLTVLSNKRYNVLTRIGNTARTTREGGTSDTQWFLDSLINLDNYVEQLQTEVYNVFLREGKIKYNTDGQGLQYRAADNISNLFVINGSFSDRPVADTSVESGRRIEPAYTITLGDLAVVTASDRANRIGPPMTIDVNETGAIHSTRINVNVFA